MRVPSSVTIRPLTEILPAWIIRSASRREATPAAARTFWSRTPRDASSGVVAVVVALAFVRVRVLVLRVRFIIIVVERGHRHRLAARLRRELRRHGAELLERRQVGERVEAEVGQE